MERKRKEEGQGWLKRGGRERRKEEREEGQGSGRREVWWAGEPPEAEACSVQNRQTRSRKGPEALLGTQHTLMPTWYSRTFFRARTCMWLDTSRVPHATKENTERVRRRSQDGQGTRSTPAPPLADQGLMGELGG